MKLSQKILTLFLAASISGCQFLVNRFAFFPQKGRAYPQEHLPANVSEQFVTTNDGVRIFTYHFKVPSTDTTESPPIIIYFHGNAGNIDHRIPDFSRLRELGVEVFGVGYRGYGLSKGRPSESGVYKDADAAYAYVRDTLRIAPEKILVMGRSLGSAVATYLASEKPVGGVILVSPFTSGREHARYRGFGPLSLLAGKSFSSTNRIKKINAPVLIIHGTRDNVVPHRMGEALFAAANEPKEIVSIDNGDHNSLSELHAGKYYRSIKTFLTTHFPSN